MPDPATVSAIFTSLKSAIALARAAKSAADAYADSPLKFQLVELLDALVEAKSVAGEAELEILDLKRQLVEANDEIRTLKASQKLQGEVVYECPVYWREEGAKREGPFCQRCWDSDSKLIRLHTKADYPGLFMCKECKNNFTSPDYRPPPSPISKSVNHW